MKVAKLACPQCGHEQPIDPKYDGQQFACPQCGQAATVVTQEQPLNTPPPPSGPSAARQRGAAAASAFSGLFARGKENPLFIVQAVDAFLNKIRGGFKATWYEKISALLSTLGQYAILVVAILCVVAGIVMAIKIGAFSLIFVGILLAFITLFLQYLALKFLDLIDSLHESNTLYFTSRTLFDVSAASAIFMVVMMLILTVVALVSGTGATVPPELRGFVPGGGGDWMAALISLGGFALFVYVQLFFLLNPEELLGVEFKSNTAGGEVFLSLLSVGIKMTLKLTPTIFGLGCVILGSQLAYYSLTALFSSNAMQASASLANAYGGFILIATLPVIVYFVCILLSFFIDLALAVMRTARNTDPKNRENTGADN